MLRTNDRKNRWVFLREFDWLGDTIPPTWVRDLGPWRAVVREESYGANLFTLKMDKRAQGWETDVKIDTCLHNTLRLTPYLCGVEARILADRLLRRLNGLPVLSWYVTPLSRGTSIVWYDGMVRCDPDLGCVWVAPLLAGESPFDAGRERALRRLANEWKVTR